MTKRFRYGALRQIGRVKSPTLRPMLRPAARQAVRP